MISNGESKSKILKLSRKNEFATPSTFNSCLFVCGTDDDMMMRLMSKYLLYKEFRRGTDGWSGF